MLGAGTGDISIKEDLQYDPLTPGVNPLQLGTSPRGPMPESSDETISDIESIMTSPVTTQRDAIFNTFTLLGSEGLTNGDLSALAANAGSVFVDEPLLIT